MNKPYLPLALAGLSLSSTSLHAAGIAGEIEEMFVYTQKPQSQLQGEAEAASVGTVLAHQLEHRPLLRPAEILEMVPGMVITQHSGEGKANQYFLRGFNLDHATDFANYVEGAPVNNVSHGHGQGYSDLNFLIPELTERMVYKKGPYYAGEGDFSTAGSARIYYKHQLDKPSLKLGLGEDGYRRALLSGGQELGDGNAVYAFEKLNNDGPWENAQRYRKDNLFLKYSQGNNDNGLSVSAMYYDAVWNSTDQIPQRLVDSGQLDRFGTLDPETGGDTHRYQLAYQQWLTLNDRTRLNLNAYWVDYGLRLTTNATYFSGDDSNTDQFTQFDERDMLGGRAVWVRKLNDSQQLDIGVEFRTDDIGNVGVGASNNGRIYEMTYQGDLRETSAAGYISLHSQWNDWFATIIGARYDYFSADVNTRTLDGVQSAAALEAASGKVHDKNVSPKFSLRFGPFAKTEIFLNYGEGFHSNDARGAVADNTVPLIAESEGYELGLRSAAIDKMQLSLVFFHLELDSELVFVGDDGTTEPRDGTERQGVELGLIYQPNHWLSLDLDYAYSDAEFKQAQYDGTELLGKHVPDSVEEVLSLGASIELPSGFYGGLRYRYFGPRNLTESGHIQSDSTAVINANLGYQFPSGLALGIEVLNLLDREDNDITYWYASRTQAERDANIDPIEDFHAHPMVPRTVRASISYQF